MAASAYVHLSTIPGYPTNLPCVKACYRMHRPGCLDQIACLDLKQSKKHYANCINPFYEQRGADWFHHSRITGCSRHAFGVKWRLMSTDCLLETDMHESDDGSAAIGPEPLEEVDSSPVLAGWKPPRYLWRALAAIIIGGQVIWRILKGRIHVKNTMQQLKEVGPSSLGVNLLTASFVGMVFTIQFVREFAKLGLTKSVGGVLALALSRELSPVVTAVIFAGRVGSAFAAELGTMQVSEQTDTLRVLRTDPIDYLVTPRVIACCIAMPLLTLMCFTIGMAASVLLADGVYKVSANIILDSAKRALLPWDIFSTMIKSVAFGGIISTVSCSWGITTLGGAKGVGESTTAAVVISLVWIFIADFILSWCFYQGTGDALKAAMG